VCGTEAALPETCPSCAGRRLSPFGWGAERVEHAVRRRFPRAHVVRYDPDATRASRGEGQRAAAASADVIVGTRGALRLFGPSSLGLAGFVSPDQLLRLPDFRASERLFALTWAAVERVRADGAVVIQSQTPTHYVFTAVAQRRPEAFYQPELEFRQEAGYPPLRRLAVVTVRAPHATSTRQLADEVFAALRGASGITVYPPSADRAERVCRVVVKGGEDLPRRVGPALAEFRAPRPRRHGIIEVEVDPVEWPF
jgi:primosomal protein N' (replication factor Y)